MTLRPGSSLALLTLFNILGASACSSANGAECPTEFRLLETALIGTAGSSGDEELACHRAARLRLSTALPPAPGNRYGDNEKAARLGFEIFYDARFSTPQDTRCATCHPPETAFQDGDPTPEKFEAVKRNSPGLFNVARQRWQMWDGRADSLWSQPLLALENPDEMNFTRLELAHRIKRTYATEYIAVFGPLPQLDDATRFPSRGKPGQPAFDGMAVADQQAINRLAANIGKALDAYMRKIVTGDAALDRYLDGQATALTPAAQRGLSVFLAAGCDACHGGPNLTDDGFHNIGVPARAGEATDPGRSAGRLLLLQSAYNLRSPYADQGDPSAGPTGSELADRGAQDEGAFKTPSLRNVGLTGPYGHNGFFTTLEAVVDFHLAGGGNRAEGHRFLGAVSDKLKPTQLNPSQHDDLMTFLRSLDGEYPPAPWNNWPDR